MATLADFLVPLLRDGVVVLRGERPREAGDPAAVRRVLAGAHERALLDLAGPAVEFVPDLAASAAALLHHACWALLTHDERPEELRNVLRMPRPPRTPADHLSADLTLRYLPQIWHRASAVDPADPLVAILAHVLRVWPLSGVLADLPEGPERPVDLGAHHGLLLLYAERYVARLRPEWQPTGPGEGYVELVRESLSRSRTPAFPRRATAP